MRSWRRVLPLLAAALLGGCEIVGAGAGLAAGIINWAVPVALAVGGLAFSYYLYTR